MQQSPTSPSTELEEKAADACATDYPLHGQNSSQRRESVTPDIGTMAEQEIISKPPKKHGTKRSPDESSHLLGRSDLPAHLGHKFHQEHLIHQEAWVNAVHDTGKIADELAQHSL
jgi:hypothetical protein